MEIIIKETGLIEELSIIDSKTGFDWICDLIGNHDGFGEDIDCQFVRELDEDGCWTGRCITSQENFYWWDCVVTQIEEVEERIEKLKDEFGFERVESVVCEANYGNSDLEDYAAVLHQYLDDEFGEEAGK